MSDDLISRKALLEEIAISFVIPILKINLRPEHKTVFRIEEIIENTPIAFDKEKVIEELDNCRKIMLSPTNKDCFGEECRENDCLACVFNKAMEIVKKGGIG